MPLYDQLSKTSREVYLRASFEVTNMHHPLMGPEYILLGLLSKNDNGAYRVLNSFGVTHEVARLLVKDMHTPVIRGDYPAVHSSASAKAVINAAIALANGHETRPTHLLAALLKSDDVNVVQLFDSFRVDRQSMLKKTIDAVHVEEN